MLDAVTGLGALNDEAIDSAGLGMLDEYVARRLAEGLEVGHRARVCCQHLECATLRHLGDGLLGFQDGQRAVEPFGVEHLVGHAYNPLAKRPCRRCAAVEDVHIHVFVYLNGREASSARGKGSHVSAGTDIPTRRGGAARPARLVTHPLFRKAAFGRHHPLATGRQAAVLDLIAALGWLDPACLAEIALADRAVLERFHDKAYLDALEAASAAVMANPEVRARYNLGSLECPVFDGLWDRARASVGGSIGAAELALQGFVAFHPGGGTHHGRPDRASGFCYLNDPVFAILRLLDAGLGRVLYVDLDAHHGDGVQDAFAADPRVHFFSIHEEGRWPGTGGIADTLGGRAVNVPVPRGINDSEYKAITEALLAPLLANGLEAVVITLGADGLAGDPLSAMQLSNDVLWRVTERCVAATPHAVVVGGGGYNPWTTARLWAGLWGRLLGKPLPDVLPNDAGRILARLDSDLVDDDDRSPHWLTTLADPPNDGPIRPEIARLIATLRPTLQPATKTATDEPAR